MRRTDAGYRLYSERDLVRLEQIVLLKFLGFSLRQIGDLLADDSDMLGTLRLQCAALGAKRTQLNRAIQVIRETETALAGSPKPDWKDLVKIIKEVEMNNDNEWMKKYYSDEAKSKLEKRRHCGRHSCKLGSAGNGQNCLPISNLLSVRIQAAQRHGPY